MFIRFIGVVKEEGDPFGDLTFDYFELFRGAGARVRMASLGPVMLNPDIFRSFAFERWRPYQEHFTTPLEKPYINAVCGNLEMLEKGWTKGVSNVAIVPSQKVGEWLKNGLLFTRPYDYTFTDLPLKPDEALSILEGLR